MLTVAVMILLIEIFLRIFYPQNLNITRLDADKVYEYKPGIKSILRRQEFYTHVTINSEGWRDEVYSIEKPKNTKRIAIAGDSFVFGFGVEENETFAKILERKLNENSKINYEVMNFGESAYGTEQEYFVIKDDVLKYSPDLIILAFSPNDLKENVKFNLFDVKNNSLVRNPPKEISTALKIRNYISWHSHLYSLFYFSVIDNADLRNFLVNAHLLNAPFKEPSTDFDSLIYQNSNNADFKYSMNKTLLLLNGINKMAENKNTAFALFIIPAKEQADKNEMLKYAESRKLDASKLNITLTQDSLKDALNKENIAIMDPLPQFVKSGRNNTFYYNIDSHWNKNGHEFAANAIYEKLINAKLVP